MNLLDAKAILVVEGEGDNICTLMSDCEILPRCKRTWESLTVDPEPSSTPAQGQAVIKKTAALPVGVALSHSLPL